MNAMANSGGTSLMFAAGAGHTETAEVLIAAGADVNAKLEAKPEFLEQVRPTFDFLRFFALFFCDSRPTDLRFLAFSWARCTRGFHGSVHLTGFPFVFTPCRTYCRTPVGPWSRRIPRLRSTLPREPRFVGTAVDDD